MKKTRINWRDLARQIVNDEDLIHPDVQTDHPLMKQLAEIVYYNALSDCERNSVERLFGSTGTHLSMRDCYKIARHGKPDMAELEELLFSGLMSDIDYEDYEEMRERKPEISARQYFDELCSYNEKDRAVKKLAEIFAAILDAPETSEEHTNYISRQEFEQMKGDLNWVTKNLKGLDKSKKLWAK